MKRVCFYFSIFCLFASMAASVAEDLTRRVPNDRCYSKKGDSYTQNVPQRPDWPEKCDYRIFFFNDVDTPAQVPDARCVDEVISKINAAMAGLSGDQVMYILGLADSRGADRYNVDLAQRRVKNVWNLLDNDIKEEKHNSRHVQYYVAGSADDIAEYGGDGRTSNPRERAVCVIIGGRDGPAGFTKIVNVTATRTTTNVVTLAQSGSTAASSLAKIQSALSGLLAIEGTLGDASVWKTKDGNFNGARLASDAAAGVVLGTAGGLITSHLVKKNQINSGFNDIQCTIGGQVVAEFGDDFVVGIR